MQAFSKVTMVAIALWAIVISPLSLAADSNKPDHTSFIGKVQGQVTDRAVNNKSIEGKCSLMLWVIDTDANGLNIRNAASSTAKVIGTLPNSTEFIATDSDDGWIKLKNPVAFESDWVPITTGPKTGWLHGSLVTTSLRDRRMKDDSFSFSVYRKPDLNSEVVASWPHSQWWSPANDIPAIKKVLACDKGWLKVDLEDGKQQAYTGWIHPDNQCPNQVTTCP